MPKALIEIDLSETPYKNDMIHNRWHPDIPIVAWVKPGDDFIVQTYDWTGGFIKNDDPRTTCAISTSPSCTSCPGRSGRRRGARRSARGRPARRRRAAGEPMGLQRLLLQEEWRRLLTDHFPLRRKSIWDISGLYTHSRHVPGVSFAGLIHPGLIGCLPDQKLLETWNARETASSRPTPIACRPWRAALCGDGSCRPGQG
jgi:formamidase